MPKPSVKRTTTKIFAIPPHPHVALLDGVGAMSVRNPGQTVLSQNIPPCHLMPLLSLRETWKCRERKALTTTTRRGKVAQARRTPKLSFTRVSHQNFTLNIRKIRSTLPETAEKKRTVRKLTSAARREDRVLYRPIQFHLQHRAQKNSTYGHDGRQCSWKTHDWSMFRQ